jgi:hypothetical protein
MNPERLNDRQFKEADQAVEQLTRLLDGIESRLNEDHRVAGLDERNRLTLLFGHAIFAMLVVPGFALLSKSGMKSPSFALIRNIPGAPFTLAAWIGLAGFALAVATIHRNRTGEFSRHLDWEHGPAIYAPIVYAHLAYAMGGHIYTLWKRGLKDGGGP